METFKDILEDRRSHSDIVWVMKKYTPAKTKTELKICNPLLYQFYVLNDYALADYIKELSKSKGLSTEQLYILAEKILREIGYNRNIGTVRSVGLVVLKIMKRILNKIYVAESNLLKVKCDMGNNPVIFLPTHRSYADFILMAYICFEYNIEIPAVVAGMDFHSMLFVSNLLRSCGALFMRRSFNDDKIYATIFKMYIKTVLKSSPAPFEFFIEGTRSRSGKSLMPKLGLLKIAVELYKSGAVPDVTLVPISISYDRVMEDVLMAYEVLGKPKPKESTKGLFKGIRTMDKQYGNIYINVNGTISLKEYLCNSENSLLDLALNVVGRQQNNSVITCFNVLAIVISCDLNNGLRSCWLLSHLINEVRYVKNLLKMFNAFIGFKDGDEEIEIIRSSMIHDKLLTIDDKYLVKFTNSLAIWGEQLDIMPDQVPLMMIQYYANPCLHFLVNPALILSLVMTQKIASLGELYAFYQLLRVLLADEFVFYKKNDQTDFDRTMDILQNAKLISVIPRDDVTTFEFDKKCSEFCFTLLHPFIRGCGNICEFFSDNLDVAFEEKMLVGKIRNYICQKYQSFGSNSVHIYSLSSSFILNVLRSLSSADIIRCKRSSTTIYICENESSRLSSITQFLRSLMTCSVGQPTGHVDDVFLLCKL